MASPTLNPVTWTPYTDLDGLLADLLDHWRRILGDNLAGAYLQGSFALGAGDLHSDCDWMVATHGPLTDGQVAALREVHDEIPTRDGHWPHDFEGSFAPLAELAVGRPPRPGVAVQRPRLDRDARLGRPLQPRLHPLDPARARHHPDRSGAAVLHGAGARRPAEGRGTDRDPDPDRRSGDVARHRHPRVGAAVRRRHGVARSSTRSRPARSPASPVRWSGRSAPSTPGGGHCWPRSGTTARSWLGARTATAARRGGRGAGLRDVRRGVGGARTTSLRA